MVVVMVVVSSDSPTNRSALAPARRSCPTLERNDAKAASMTSASFDDTSNWPWLLEVCAAIGGEGCEKLLRTATVCPPSRRRHPPQPGEALAGTGKPWSWCFRRNMAMARTPHTTTKVLA